jgi:hypothetical protein
VSTLVPPLFAGLVDDASLLPPGVIGTSEALAAHAEHRSSWYAGLIGALLVPSSLVHLDLSPRGLAVGVVNDAAIGALPAVVTKLRATGSDVARVEAAVARRGEDPQPGLSALGALAAETTDLDVYAEIPLSWGSRAWTRWPPSAPTGCGSRPSSGSAGSPRNCSRPRSSWLR